MAAVAAGTAAEPAALHVGACGGDPVHRIRRRCGDVGDGLVRFQCPLSAVVVPLRLRIKIIVWQHVPPTERCMIVTGAGDMEVVGVNSAGADGGRSAR